MTTRAEADSAAPATTRRGLLIGGAAAAIGGAFAARGAFSHAASVGGAETGHAPRPGGELVVAFDGTTISTFALDPHNSGFAPHNRVMRLNVADCVTECATCTPAPIPLSRTNVYSNRPRSANPWRGVADFLPSGGV